MNGNHKSFIAKLAGTLGVAGASSLIAFPSLASSLNPNPTVFSEAPYTRLAQAMPDSSTPDSSTMMSPGSSTEGMMRSSSPSLAKVNPNPSIFNEAPYNRVLSQSTGGAGSLDGSTSQPAAPRVNPGSTPEASPSDSSSPSAPVAEPSNVGPTIQQSPSDSTTTPGDNTTTPTSGDRDVTVPTTSGESTVTPTPGGTTTPDSTITPNSTTTPDSTITPDTTAPESTTPDSTTTPSATPSEGNQSGGVRALW